MNLYFLINMNSFDLDHPSTILTHIFIHKDLQHFLSNILTLILFVYGYNCYRILPMTFVIGILTDLVIHLCNGKSICGASAMVYATAGYCVCAFPDTIITINGYNYPMSLFVSSLPVSDLLSWTVGVKHIARVNHIVAMFAGGLISKVVLL